MKAQESPPRRYQKLNETKALTIAALDKAGKSRREIAQSTGVAVSTVQWTLKQLEQGRVPGNAHWTLERFNRELERRSRQAVYNWQSIAEDSHILVSAGIKSVAHKIEQEGVTIAELDKLTAVGKRAVEILTALEQYTSPKENDTSESALDQLSGQELLQRIEKLQRKLKRETTVEAQVIEATAQEENQSEEQAKDAQETQGERDNASPLSVNAPPILDTIHSIAPTDSIAANTSAQTPPVEELCTVSGR